MEWCTFAIIIHLRNLLALKKEKEVRLFLFFCSVDPLSITTDQLLVIQNSRPLTRCKIRGKCSISSKINFNLMEKVIILWALPCFTGRIVFAYSPNLFRTLQMVVTASNLLVDLNVARNLLITTSARVYCPWWKHLLDSTKMQIKLP